MAPTIHHNLITPAHLFARAQDPNNPPLCSVFALVIDRSLALASGTSSNSQGFVSSRDITSLDSPIHYHIEKRQSGQILVIPTTYATINSSPSPAAVVGATLGAVGGFLLVLAIVAFILRNTFGGGGDVIEEEYIRRERRSKHSNSASSMSEVIAPPPVASRRTSRVTRRESTRRVSRPSRRDEVIVEEDLSISDRPEVVVEEDPDSDIVEVIEEHSPAPARRKPKRNSGFRTVDPGAYGGGDDPVRRLSRR